MTKYPQQCFCCHEWDILEALSEELEQGSDAVDDPTYVTSILLQVHSEVEKGVHPHSNNVLVIHLLDRT